MTINYRTVKGRDSLKNIKSLDFSSLKINYMKEFKTKISIFYSKDHKVGARYFTLKDILIHPS